MRRLRNERAWTQEDFSAKLQILGWERCTRSWLSCVEARPVAVCDYELTYFCKAFAVPLAALFPSLDPSKADPKFEVARPEK